MGTFKIEPPSVKSRGFRNDASRSVVYNLLSGGNGSRFICDNKFGFLYNDDAVDGLLFAAILNDIENFTKPMCIYMYKNEKKQKIVLVTSHRLSLLLNTVHANATSND